MKYSDEHVTDFLRECDSSGVTVITDTEPMVCSDCGNEAELRPYGKGGAWVCFDCGMKDEAEASRKFAAHLNGVKHKAGSA